MKQEYYNGTKGQDCSVLTKPPIMERSIKDHHDIDINIDVTFERDDKMVIEQVEIMQSLTKTK